MPNNPLGPRPGGTASKLNVSATTVVRATGGGTLYRVCVLVAGSAGAIYDNNSTSTGNTAANKIGVIPNTVGVYNFTWPVQKGITYVPGASQVVSISYA